MDKFLLMKRGLYYRPENAGYTGIKEHAGRYPESDASPDHGITAIHEDDAPEYSDGCYIDLAREHAEAKLTQARAEIARLRKDVQFLGEQLFMMEHLQDHQRIKLVQDRYSIHPTWKDTP